VIDEAQNRVYTVPEASYILKYSSSSICKMIERGLLSGRKKGREWLITKESIDCFIKRFWSETVIK